MANRVFGIVLGSLYTAIASTAGQADEKLTAMTVIQVDSSADGASQPSLLWTPINATRRPTPMLVWLHSWSFDYRQKDALAYQEQAERRGWIFLAPNFRGKNDRPEAGGSSLARMDIIDAIDFVQRRFEVDASRVYLAGGSGGGHMALLMAGYHPVRFSAVSAWVPITDLQDWYQFHTRSGGAERYARGVAAVCGGPPGASDVVDLEYRARSPIYHLARARDLPIDIAAGVNDSAVPIRHSLWAFNRLAESTGGESVSQAEITQLQDYRKLYAPRAEDQVPDDSYGHEILLRRQAGAARVTIFDGGHIAIPEACCVWLAKQRRNAVTSAAGAQLQHR